MKSASWLLAAALLTGLALRLCLLLIPAAPFATKVLEPTGDSPEYVRLAANLVHGRAFSQDSAPPYRPDILRTPVYPLFLALPLLLTAHSSLLSPPSTFLVLAVSLQLLLSLAIVWLTLRLGLELGLEPSASALAALLVALSPNLVFYSVKLTTEMLFLSLLLVTLLLASRFRTTRRWRELIAAGVGCGLLILTRPIAVFLPLLLALYILWLGTMKAATRCGKQGLSRAESDASAPRDCHSFSARNWQLGIRNSTLLLACTFIVLAPWVIRNRRVSGSYTLSTAFDYNVSEYSGALTMAAARSMPVSEARDSLAAEAQAQYGPLNESDQASYWAVMAKVGRQQISSQPLLAAKIHAAGSVGGLLMPLSIRALRVFSGVDPTASTAGTPGVAQKTLQLVARGRIGPALALIWRDRLATLPPLAVVILLYAIMFHLALLVAAFVSLFLKRSRRLLWLLLPILYFVLTTGPVGEARFRVPIEPLLCLFAAVALTRAPRQPSAARHSSSGLT
ncbi:glycosyltransferase family 39 protein [candidate division WOR-3 bacterium]|nr:glycosyltransferase family 39 protein [candidate division WOR-3 bacterium]